MKTTKQTDSDIMGKAAETARAFKELSDALRRSADRILDDLSDGSPEKERRLLALRMGLFTKEAGKEVIRDAVDRMDRVQGYFLNQTWTTDPITLVDKEPEVVAHYLADAASRIAIVVGALAVELDDVEAENAARALRRARRAA